MNEMTDPDCLGLETRFSNLFDRTYSSVLAYARRRTNSLEEAQDIAAQAFEVLWQKIDTLPADADYVPWLYCVARRCLANKRRREITQLVGIDTLRFEAELAASTCNFASEAGDLVDVERALRELHPQEQELILLSVWEGLSHAQIGIALGISENAVAIRLYRARERLKTRLNFEDKECSHDQRN